MKKSIITLTLMAVLALCNFAATAQSLTLKAYQARYSEEYNDEGQPVMSEWEDSDMAITFSTGTVSLKGESAFGYTKENYRVYKTNGWEDNEESSTCSIECSPNAPIFYDVYLYLDTNEDELTVTIQSGDLYTEYRIQDAAAVRDIKFGKAAGKKSSGRGRRR